MNATFGYWTVFTCFMATRLVAVVFGPIQKSYRRQLYFLLALDVIIGALPINELLRAQLLSTLTLILITFAAPRVVGTLHLVRKWMDNVRGSPIVLSLPFGGQWRVFAGGPLPWRNHHTVVTDQLYAYDFVRVGASSMDEPIYAPSPGIVAYVEDWHEEGPVHGKHADDKDPAGNYVSIKMTQGYVLLCHLRKSSIVVKPGDIVSDGELIARCGNSGNSFRPHLHLHVQDRERIAVNVAHGIAVRFRPPNRGRILFYGNAVNKVGTWSASKE